MGQTTFAISTGCTYLHLGAPVVAPPPSGEGWQTGVVPNRVKFCGQCGTEVPADDRFCGSCGHELGQQVASSPPEPAQTGAPETPTTDSLSPTQRFLQQTQDTVEAPATKPPQSERWGPTRRTMSPEQIVRAEVNSGERRALAIWALFGVPIILFVRVPVNVNGHLPHLISTFLPSETVRLGSVNFRRPYLSSAVI